MLSFLPGISFLSINCNVTLEQHYCFPVYVHFVNRAPVSNNFEMNDAWGTRNIDVYIECCCVVYVEEGI